MNLKLIYIVQAANCFKRLEGQINENYRRKNA